MSTFRPACARRLILRSRSGRSTLRCTLWPSRCATGSRFIQGQSHRPVIWASEKSRRFYFAMRAGWFASNYTRNSDAMSQRLGPGWTVRKQSQATYIVGNKATYAAWVQSAKRQQPQHKATGWKTDAQAVDELTKAVISSGLPGKHLAISRGET